MSLSYYIYPMSNTMQQDPSLTRSSGVAVGSSIGHAVGGLFGGSSSNPAETQDNAVASQQTQDGGYQNNGWAQESCEPAAKGLASCLDQNSGNMQICTWYLEQLVG